MGAGIESTQIVRRRRLTALVVVALLFVALTLFLAYAIRRDRQQETFLREQNGMNDVRYRLRQPYWLFDRLPRALRGVRLRPEVNVMVCDEANLDRLVSLGLARHVVAVYWQKETVSPGAMARLSHFPALRTIDLYQAGINDAALLQLGTLPKLAYLDLAETAATDVGLAVLSRLPNLTALSLSYTGVTDAGLVLIGRWSHLRSLSLVGTAVSDRGLASLASQRHLYMLDLARTKVTSAGLVHLRGMGDLQCLGLGETGVSDVGLPQLAGLQHLYQLDLVGASITVAGLAPLVACKRLEYLGTNDATARSVDHLIVWPSHCRVYVMPEAWPGPWPGRRATERGVSPERGKK